jgi:LuxR family maltose regulon positive regulatory protein
MPTQILSTKLFIPPPRRDIVIRNRLNQRLNEGLNRKLTLISAPAGFGKTTIVSEFLAGLKKPVAWLSLDKGDNDPKRFWIHIVAALQTIFPIIGEEAMGALQSLQMVAIESILSLLLNEINDGSDEFALVLDDYHSLDSKQIDEGLSFLIENMPQQMHVIIATREDPNLPLARYRASAQLTELRINELRFTNSEAADFLNLTMGLNLSTEEITALEIRTEGWISGLQLAALSMQGLEDTTSFIHSFTGSHRFILDYLIEEILHQKPEPIQNFLMQTSILERLCAPLIEAVLSDSSINGHEILEQLERTNLFIIALDNERHWYRYHHLFREMLQNQLTRTYPDQIMDLHQRASDWYSKNDFIYEAISHALVIQDWSRAAEIIENHSDELPIRGENATLLGWFELIPSQYLVDRPGLGLVYAWALFMSNQLERAEQQLDQLSPFVQSNPSYLGEHYVIRVIIAARKYDKQAFFDLAREALTRLPIEEASPRSRILVTLGLAYEETSCDILSAKSAFNEAYELGITSLSPSLVGNAPLPLIALAYLADYELLEGNLYKASQLYEKAIGFSKKWDGSSSLAQSFVQQGKSSLLYEWNDLDNAAYALRDCIRIGELWKSSRLLIPAYGLSAKILHTKGQTEEAQKLIRLAEKISLESYTSISDLATLAFYQISLWITSNDFQHIARWEQDHDVEWLSQTGRMRDALTIILIRAQLAKYHRFGDSSILINARKMIDQTMKQVMDSGLMYNATRLHLLDALVYFEQKNTKSAATALYQALVYAKPENYIRSFLDLGFPLLKLLEWSLNTQPIEEAHLIAYINKLLTLFELDGGRLPKQNSIDLGHGLLSERELDVLRLISMGLSNREIGEKLFIALSTVKGHIQIIFDKLQVKRRTEAVARARELGFL